MESKGESRRAYQHQWYINHTKGTKRRPQRVERLCEYCAKEISLQPNQIEGRQHNFCSQKCYALWLSQNKRGESSNRWKGGSRRNGAGYIEIRLQPDNFFYSMMSIRHYVLEHRLVMAQHLKRCLLPWEVIHHINGQKDDNRIENLQLLGSRGKHNTAQNKVLKRLLRENIQLKKRIAELEQRED